MSIASPLSYLTSITDKQPMPSTLSIGDRSFIEFARCLYGAKTIVKELEAFGATVISTVSLPSDSHKQRYDLHISVDEFIDHVNQYLDESIYKFNGMCKAMLIVLAKLEKTQPVKRECIDSFREELIHEWRKAELIKQEVLSHLHKENSDLKKDLATDNSPNKTPAISDDDNINCSSSETTPEPSSSESP